MADAKQLDFVVAPERAGERLDAALAALAPEFSRAFFQKLIRDGRVALDGVAVVAPRTALRAGQRLTVAVPAAAPAVPAAEPFDFPVLFEDASMLVIDKPAGVVVHPAAGNLDGTVVNALLGRYPALADGPDVETGRAGIVHRLDKDTSGCLAVALTASAQFRLAAAFADRTVHKTYLALVRGVPKNASGRIETLIGRHPVNRQKMAVVPRNGKPAVTLYRRVASGVCGTTPYALLEVDILTGRTHQIRVHCASIGHPVLGDGVYGGAVDGVPAARQLLHAWHLSLPHPESGETLHFTAPVPADMAALIRALPGGERYVD